MLDGDEMSQPGKTNSLKHHNTRVLSLWRGFSRECSGSSGNLRNGATYIPLIVELWRTGH